MHQKRLVINFVCLSVCVHSFLQLCRTLCDPMDYLTRVPCPRDSSGKNNGVDCYSLLQGIFLTQGSNLHLLHLCSGRWIIYHECHLGSPKRTQIFLLIHGWLARCLQTELRTQINVFSTSALLYLGLYYHLRKIYPKDL